MVSPARTHRTQQERSETTRTLLLDATIECLVELGYARTSVNEICKRAGVSRGAQQHHFTTKAELMTAAVEHLTLRSREAFLDTAECIPSGPARIETGIDLIWQGFSATLAPAFMELWIAARTDAELRESLRPVDRALGRSTLELYQSFAGELAPERVETLFWLTVNLIRGLAVDAEIGGDPARRAQLLDEWKRIAVAVYDGAGHMPTAG
jgi:AcrR family transcriptional regulator